MLFWLPSAVEELYSRPGNVTRLVRHFSDPASVPIGFWEAFTQLFSRLQPRTLVVDPWVDPGRFGDAAQPFGTWTSSGATLAAWMLSALVAIKLRNRSLLVLQAMAFSGLAVGFVAASRIIGLPAGYLLFWFWGLALLLVIACAATFGIAAARTLPPSWWSRAQRWLPALTLAALAPMGLRLAWSAERTRPRDYAQGSVLVPLARDTIAAIGRDQGPASGKSGRYLVSWADPLQGGALGLGLANELERAGFDVACEPQFAWLVGKRRVSDPEWASARIQLAAGGWIAEAQQIADAVMVSRVDFRTTHEKNEALALQRSLAEALRADGRDDLAAMISYDLGRAMHANPRQNPLLVLAATRLTTIGFPTAVFILPAQATLVRTIGSSPRGAR